QDDVRGLGWEIDDYHRQIRQSANKAKKISLAFGGFEELDVSRVPFGKRLVLAVRIQSSVRYAGEVQPGDQGLGNGGLSDPSPALGAGDKTMGDSGLFSNVCF